jgi:hypothetical protein
VNAVFELPTEFSLLQAALWLVRGRTPIPDEIFQAAPIKLQESEITPAGPLGELTYALRAGRITASTGVAFVLVLTDTAILVPVPRTNTYTVPPEDWVFGQIRWNSSGLDWEWCFEEEQHQKPFSADPKLMAFLASQPDTEVHLEYYEITVSAMECLMLFRD